MHGSTPSISGWKKNWQINPTAEQMFASFLSEREICKAIVKSLMARDVAIVIGDDRRL